MVFQNPQICNAIGTSCSVIEARKKAVSAISLAVGDLPMAIADGVLQSLDLVKYIIVTAAWPGARATVELPYAIVTGASDVEVKPPVDVMVVHMAHTHITVLGSCETKPGPERAVNMEPPLGYISVPACFHLRLQDNL